MILTAQRKSFYEVQPDRIRKSVGIDTTFREDLKGETEMLEPSDDGLSVLLIMLPSLTGHHGV